MRVSSGQSLTSPSPSSIASSARLEPDAVDAAIEAVVFRCRTRNVPTLWWTRPGTRPTNLGTCLEGHGFVHGGDLAGMALDMQGMNEDLAPPADLTIEQGSDDETLKHWCHLFSVGFGWPDFARDALPGMAAIRGFGAGVSLRCYICWLKGEPVATSSLFLGAGVARIEFVACHCSRGTAARSWLRDDAGSSA